MRHNKKVNHLGRTSSHRRALLANLACSLIKEKRIETTLAKAKALRIYLEPLVTKSKTANNSVVTTITKKVVVNHKDGKVETIDREFKLNSSTHSRHIVFSYLNNKLAVQELFGTIAPKVADRPGGYLRILKTGFRSGDAAEMAMIEFVDFNDLMLASSSTKAEKKTTRRSRKKAPKTEPVSEL